MQDKKTINGKLMLAVSVFVCVFVVSVYSSVPNPGHSANQVGSGTFYGESGDVWSFPGRVGIGTTSPDYSLTVGNYVKVGSGIDGEYGYLWGNPGNLWNLYKPVGSTDLVLLSYGAGGNVMSFKSATGYVGIGTTAPSYNLHVVGNIYASGNITCGGSNCGVGGGNVSGGYWNLSGSSLYPVSTSYNVGIGTTGPLDLLHLKGSTRADLKLEGGYTGGITNVGKLSFSYTPRGGDTNNLNIGLIDVYNTATDSTSGGYMAFHTRPTSGSLTERLRIDSSGKVGIGTTVPGGMLDIVKTHSSGTAQEMFRTAFDSNWGLRLVQNYAGSGDIKYELKEKYASTEYDVLAFKAGNVGIGTTSPVSLLHVSGNAGAVAALDSTTKFLVDNTGDGVVAQFNNANAADAETLLGFSYRQGATVPPVSLGYHIDTDGWTGVSKGSLVFKTRSVTTVTAPTERMRITSAGNVGIGTTSPVDRLEVVNGNDKVQLPGEGGIIGGRNSGAFAIMAGSWSNGNIVMAPYGATGGLYLNYGGNASNGGVHIFDGGTSTERVRIQSNGNVGIGTAAPDGKLDVETPEYTWGVSLLRSGTRVGGLHSNGGILHLQAASGGAYVAVANNGNVGIGTTGPISKLHVEDPDMLGGSDIFEGIRIAHKTNVDGFFPNNAGSRLSFDFLWQGTTRQTVGAIEGHHNSGWGGGLLFLTTPAGSPSNVPLVRMAISPAGNVGIGTTSPSYQLQLSLDSAAKPGTSAWTIASDARIKKDIHPFTDGLSVINGINPVWYQYNGLGGFAADGKDYIGVVAQDIEKVAPYTVSAYKAKLNVNDTNETELLNFNSHALTFVLINSVKEQQGEIGQLKAENDEIKRENEALKKAVCEINPKAEVCALCEVL